MEAKSLSARPEARRDALIVRDAADETLVYDTNSDRAHCLNATASVIWRLCDGTRTAPEIAAQASALLGGTVDERAVLLGLRDLQRRRLLHAPTFPQTGGLTRRDLLRAAALSAAVALPAIVSISVPTAAQAGSLGGPGAPCSSSVQCQSGICASGVCQ